MIKTNTKYLIRIIFLVSLIFCWSKNNIFANSDNLKYISGVVVYSDDKSPVSEGVIKVIKLNDIDGRSKVIETVSIDRAGNFKLFNQIIYQIDGTKLMAYPNDYDNSAPPYYPTILDFNYKKGTNNENLVIEVERTEDQNSAASIDHKNSILMQNFPNPFNPTTLIRFDLPQTSNVSLKIYDMKGDVVYTLIDNKNYLKGMNELEFNAGSLPSGIYVYILNTGNYSETRKMMLLK